MNFTKSTGTILLASLLFVGCKEKKEVNVLTPTTETVAPKIKKQIAPENLQSIRFTIEGMTCEIGCAKTIQEELNDLDGVENATVDFDKKLATVRFDKTIQTPESIKKIVEATGDGKTYKVKDMK